MINRECGVYQTTYEGDMALYPLPLARYSTLGVVAVLVLLPLATLAGQFIIEWSINHSTWISGGVQSTIFVPTPTFFGWEINSEYRRYVMVLPVGIVAYVAALNLVRSREIGRASCRERV